MTKWPGFVTKDVDPDDEGELMRRWEMYDREMKAVIASGRAHQDADGWWVETETGELIGPDPEIERPRTDNELAHSMTFEEALPELSASIKRTRGRPALEHPKKLVTLRLDADVYRRLKNTGPGWQSRVNELLRKTVGL